MSKVVPDEGFVLTAMEKHLRGMIKQVIKDEMDIASEKINKRINEQIDCMAFAAEKFYEVRRLNGAKL